jgi:hypothetical protein
LDDTSEKIIFEYEDIKGEAHALPVGNISPYLTNTTSILIEKRMTPLGKVPEIVFGSKAVDLVIS